MWLVFLLLAAVALAVLMLVVGMIAAVVAIASALPWLLIVAGIWLLVRATRGQHRDRRHVPASRPGSGPGHAPASPSSPAPRHAPSGSARPHPARPRPDVGPRRELPIDVQITVEQIRRKADMLAGYADRFPPLSQDLHIVRQTAADYLPRTVAAYLALPGDDDPLVDRATGTRAVQELRAQLRIMDGRLDDIAVDLQRQDVDRLLANRRFLEERFRPPGRETQASSACQEADVAYPRMSSTATVRSGNETGRSESPRRWTRLAR